MSDWIPLSDRLCSVRLRSSCKMTRRQNPKCGLFTICDYAYAYALMRLSQFVYNQGSCVFSIAHRTDIVVFTWDLNTDVGHLMESEGERESVWIRLSSLG